MDCLLEETILRFVSGRMASEELAAVEAHVRACTTCERLVSASLAAASDPTGPLIATSPKDGGRPEGTLATGTTVGRYTVLSFVGQGAMGEVYGAYDPKLDRRVALKLMRPRVALDHGRAEARLLREAQAIARLSHPNVITVHDMGSVGERVFVAMEYIEGHTLDVWLADRARTRGEILAVFADAARGLAAAHAAGLVHRDFKPQNVMVGADGTVRVTDFGLARRFDEAEPAGDAPSPAVGGAARPLEARLTQSGELIGTPLYMAPEQFQRRPVDARTDQFSFCVALYQALYGEHPFHTGGSIGELMATVTAGQVRAASHRTDVPVWLRRVLLRGLAVDPTARWGSMEALTAALVRQPAHSLKRWAAVAVGVVALAIGIAAVRGAKRPELLCRAGTQHLAGIWDLPGAAGSKRRHAMRAAFLATGLATAEETWTRVEALLDHYVGRWLHGYEDACVATHVRGEQSAAVLDLRMACLDERLSALRSLADLLASADRQTVEAGVDAVNALPPVERCADAHLLLAQVEPPRDEKTRSQVGDLRRRAAHAKALNDTGHHDEAIELGHTLIEEARRLAYLPVLAELLEMEGTFQVNGTFQRAALKTLEEAVWTAIRCKRDDIAAEAAALLVGVVGYYLNRPERGEEWAKLSESLLDRLGPGHDLIRAWIIQGRASTVVGKNAAAGLQLARQALALKRKVLPAEHPDIGISLLSEGEALAKMGDYAAALTSNEEAVEVLTQAYGPSSPSHAWAYSNRGEYLVALGRLKEALVSFQRALSIWEAALGSDDLLVGYPLVGYPLTGLGGTLFALGRVDEARRPLELALRIREKSEADPAERAKTQFALAQVLWAQGAKPRAIGLARKAREEYASASDQKASMSIDKWLAFHRTAPQAVSGFGGD